MIRITRLLQGTGTVSTVMKYRTGPAQDVPSRLIAFTDTRRPVVFWNITRRCNLACRHCYLDAGSGGDPELSTGEAKDLITDLADAKVPLLLFSGGEPLVRKDFFDLAAFARDAGLKTALSSNGTLITRDIAARIRACGIEYVGVSLDGACADTHDALRNQHGCFARSLRGLRACVRAGIPSGVRITVTRENYREVPALLELTRHLHVPRFCLYWLVPSGRGRDMYRNQLEPAEAREIFETLFHAAETMAGEGMEILTVDAPQDGIYLLELMQEGRHAEYDPARTLLGCTGDSCSAGNRVANIDPSGTVYPCQFMQREEFRIGSVREKKFGALWNDARHPLLEALRTKTGRLKGKCASCTYRELCGGGCRIRAYAQTGDLWAEDPFCALPPGPGA